MVYLYNLDQHIFSQNENCSSSHKEKIAKVLLAICDQFAKDFDSAFPQKLETHGEKHAMEKRYLVNERVVLLYGLQM